ncbi:MAG: VIT1/CCC1 transporter family protein, partial [Anaerolineales bacterium]
REIYLQRGYTEEEATQLVEIHSRDPKRWVDAMMIDELGMLKDESNPLVSGGVTLVAFIVAGAVPLLVYLLGLVISIPAQANFPLSISLSGLALFGLGAAKVIVTKLNPWRSGLEMLIVGGLAASVAYAVGALLKGIGG